MCPVAPSLSPPSCPLNMEQRRDWRITGRGEAVRALTDLAHPASPRGWCAQAWRPACSPKCQMSHFPQVRTASQQQGLAALVRRAGQLSPLLSSRAREEQGTANLGPQARSFRAVQQTGSCQKQVNQLFQAVIAKDAHKLHTQVHGHLVLLLRAQLLDLLLSRPSSGRGSRSHPSLPSEMPPGSCWIPGLLGAAPAPL